MRHVLELLADEWMLEPGVAPFWKVSLAFSLVMLATGACGLLAAFVLH